MPHPTLAIVGGTVVDEIFPHTRTLPHWPAHTEFTSRNLVFLRRAPLITIGGNGANSAFVASRRGARVELHTAIGSDGLGQMARHWLQGAGVTVHSPVNVAGTALNVTAANSSHQRATFFYPGTPPRLSLTALRRCAPAGVLVCGWPHPPLGRMARAFATLRKDGVLTALDTGPILTRPWSLKALRPVLASLDLLLTNEHELTSILRADTLPEAIASIRRFYTGHIILKRGPEGVWWLPRESTQPKPVDGRKVKVVNTVGAGDSFNGALLAALLRGCTLLAAIHEANQVAARVVSSTKGVLGTPPRRWTWSR